MTYMLDTDTFSNLVHSHGKVELRYALVGATATCISTITVQEIEFGRWLHPERMRRLNSRIDALLREIPAVPFDFEDARTAGRISGQRTQIDAPRKSPVASHPFVIRRQ